MITIITMLSRAMTLSEAMTILRISPITAAIAAAAATTAAKAAPKQISKTASMDVLATVVVFTIIPHPVPGSKSDLMLFSD